MSDCNAELPGPHSKVHWLLAVIVAPGLITLSLGIFSPKLGAPSVPSVPGTLVACINVVADAVPAINNIAVWTSNPAWAKFLLGIQWSFAPIYVLAWTIVVPPWSSKVKHSVMQNSKLLTGKQRILLLATLVFLVVNFLGDMGVIGFPTLFNGKFAFPPSDAIPIIKPIYSSWVYFSLYGWVSAVCESTELWALVFLLFNIKNVYSIKKARGDGVR